MKKTDLEKNKGLKIANSMKQAGAKRGGPAPKTDHRGAAAAVVDPLLVKRCRAPDAIA